MARRTTLRCGLVLAALLIVAACGGRAAPPPPTATPPSAPPASGASPAPTSRLTGLPGDPQRPVFAVKVDNTAPGRPWDGVEFADVVYVEPVEGGLTRLLAVFASELPVSVGPVRSARETDTGVLGDYGQPALVYSGAAPAVVPVVTSAPVVSTVPHDAPRAFRRSPGRPVPKNLYVDLRELRAQVPQAEPARDIGLRFGPAPEGGEPTSRRVVRYPAARVAATWAPDRGVWTIAMDGRPAVFGPDALPVSAENVVVQRVAVHDSSVKDVAGAVSPVAVTVGHGDAEVLRDGRAYPARWSRPAATAPTRLTGADGRSLPLARGRTWILLAPR